jgi:hypothetical protein
MSQIRIRCWIALGSRLDLVFDNVLSANNIFSSLIICASIQRLGIVWLFLGLSNVRVILLVKTLNSLACMR